MLKTIKILSFFLLLFCINNVAKAKKTLDKADKAYELKQYNVAVELYQKAFSKQKKKDPDVKARILYQIAQSYRLSGQIKKAAPQYKKAISAKYYNLEPLCYYYYATVLQAMSDYENAIVNFENYLELQPQDSAALRNLEACKMATEWINNPTRYEVENVRKLNTRDNEWAPRFLNNSCSELVITSSREGATGKKLDGWTGQRFSDLFISTQDKKGDWSSPKLFDEKKVINTIANEGEAFFSADGNSMYFTFCGAEKKKQLGCQIYYSHFDGENWSTPVLIPLTTDTIADCVHPFLTSDERTMFFSSNMEGGEGDLDIWYAKRSDKNSAFSNPINLKRNINTPFKEAFPFLFNDTLLYFSSTGHIGLGGYDIFRASFDGNEWGDVENLKYPMNSSGDDFGICFYPGENRGFFSSNRSGGRGGDDIYSFVLPSVVFTLAGTIKDEATLQPVFQVQLLLTGTDGSSIQTRTNNKGFYKFDASQIKPNVTYTLHTTKIDYFDQNFMETTIGLTSSKDIIRDINLQPVPKGPVVLPDILYEVGKWNLRNQYQDSLIGLIELLEANPRIVIELASHTDSRPIAMTNDSLSQYRAESVVKYLISRGINPGRLVAKGYGSSKPRKLPNDVEVVVKGRLISLPKDSVMTDEFIHSLHDKDAQELAHQMNRRTEFSILRDDFIPEESNKSISTVVVMTDQKEENNIPFEINPNGMPEIKCVANGISMSFIYNETGKENIIDIESTMKLIRMGKLTKNDFKNKEKAFDDDGEIIENSILTIKEIKIGNKSIVNIEARVKTEQAAPLELTKKTLDTIGKFKIDKQKLLLIIEKNN